MTINTFNITRISGGSIWVEYGILAAVITIFICAAFTNPW